LGYSGIENSLIIEFDTYPSNYITGACPLIADPNDNHVGLMRNGNPGHSVDSPAAVLNNITLEDGAVHTVNIAYVASTETLTVQIDGNLVATFQTSLNGIGLTDGMAWVGFTSGQGFARQDVDILSWYFNRPANCTQNQVALVSSQPQPSTTMLKDMLVSQTDGLQVLSGPAINAAKDGLLAWGSTNVIVAERLVLGTSPNNQIWYRIQKGDLSGWIIAQFNSVDYVLGGDVCTANNLPAPTQLTFRYDRKAAASYAIAHAYQNDAIWDPGSGRTTARLSRAIKVISSFLLANLIPFANFDYGGNISRQTGATGSAVFISESIWLGGLPMTTDVDLNAGCPGEDNTAGWRFCDPYFSRPWGFHTTLVSYYSKQSPHAPFTVNNNVLGDDGKGALVFISASPNAPTITTNDLIENKIFDLVGLQSGGVTGKRGPAGLFDSSRMWDFIKTNTPLHDIQAGDYLWIDSGPPPKGAGGADFHGFLVVGWGPIRACSEIMDDGINTRPIFSLQEGNGLDKLEATFTSSPETVPYIADFAGVRSSRRTQRTVPRPFYCTWYQQRYRREGNSTDPYNDEKEMIERGLESNGFGSGAFGFDLSSGKHNWYFYTLPDKVQIDVVGKLYVVTDWQWEPNSGQPVLERPQ
jgi:hypothetical protein